MMQSLLLVELVLALAGPIVWLGSYRRLQSFGEIEFGMLLWVLYGVAAILVVCLHVLHLGDPFRGLVLGFMLFAPQLFLLAAIYRLIQLTILKLSGRSTPGADCRFDVIGASVVLVASVVHHIAFMNGPWA